MFLFQLHFFFILNRQLTLSIITVVLPQLMALLIILGWPKCLFWFFHKMTDGEKLQRTFWPTQ